MYNITLQFSDGRKLTFQSPTFTINGEPAKEKNHVIALSQKDVADLMEAAKTAKGDTLHYALPVYLMGTVHDLLGD